jgi:hypothetical protein
VAPGNFGAALVSTYQKRPIVLHVATPGPAGTDAAAVDDQVDTTLVTSFGLVDRIAAFVALPGTLYQSGSGSSPATGRPAFASTSLRDPRLGLAAALVPHGAGRAVGLSAYAEAQLPTRSTTDFAGEKGFVFAPALAADVGVAGRLVLGAEVGARLRPVSQSFFGERQSTQLLGAVGAAVEILPRELLSVGAEARTIVGLGARADGVQDRSGPGPTSAHAVLGGEWLGSLRSAFLANRLSVLAGGGGTLPLDGLIGIGRVRFVLGLAYTPGAPSPRAEPPPVEPSPPVAVAPPPRPPRPAPPQETAAAVPAAPAPVAAAAPGPRGCAATCKADSFSSLPASDEAALATHVAPYLSELQVCLARVGGARVRPAVLLRFSVEGAQLDSRVDVGGYEDLGCVKETRAHAPVSKVSRGTTVRCELRCRE